MEVSRTVGGTPVASALMSCTRSRTAAPARTRSSRGTTPRSRHRACAANGRCVSSTNGSHQQIWCLDDQPEADQLGDGDLVAKHLANFAQHLQIPFDPISHIVLNGRRTIHYVNDCSDSSVAF